MAINNHDRQQLCLMKSFLIDFKGGKITLSLLIEKLDSLFNETSKIKAQWHKYFYENWLNLESIYAGCLDEKRNVLTEQENAVLLSSIRALYTLVDKELQLYPNVVDSTVSKAATVIDAQWLMCPDCVDAWKSSSKDAMVVCPKCNQALHNPRYKK
jgi:hypothetical protein